MAFNNVYFIQPTLDKKHAHHESFEQLWETKWKKPCEMGVYPFMFGAVKDFEPVVETLVKQNQKPPYNWDAYATPFFPPAEQLVTRAKEAEDNGEKEKASELYLRASALYRIARFPAPRSEKQREAWERGKDACRRGLGIHPIAPTHEVQIPHVHASGNDKSTLPAFYHHPQSSTSSASSTKTPLIVLFCGLDGYRTDLAVWIGPFSAVFGVATLVVEIPGTGDNPADPSDPTSPDRVWSSLFDWVGKQEGLDKEKVVCWGFSTGGYYAWRAAHTHRSSLLAAISQGGGCHHMFDSTWLHAAQTGEYPFDLGSTLAFKYGYTSFDQFCTEARDRYSLLTDGTLSKPCTRTLIVNGENDSIFPVDDAWVAASEGQPKEVRIVRERPHMGEPEAFGVILEWIGGLLGQEVDVGRFMGMVPMRTRF